MFCAAEDQARAKSLWTRCFRGFMALHGKLWAKNYLSNHFRDRPESKALLEQIKRSGIVDNKAFRETVAQCALLYKDLEQFVAGKSVGENKIVTASPIRDIDKIVSQQFLHINWKEWKEPSDFKRITIPAAQNISHLIRNLKIDESNDALVNDLSDLMERYQKWVDDSLAAKASATDKTPTRISDVITDLKEQDLSNICTIISEQIANYRNQREAQEPIKALLAAIDREKNRWESRGWFHISFAGQLQTSGLEGYLRRGNEGFLEDYELGTAERILKLTDGQLKQQANFLSDPEFALMKRRFDKLKQELPKIKADIHKIEVGAANIALSDPR
ncbi:MAG: hypothetical protein EBZ75_05575 [Oxalobacteraceae bacterium]|nr:hypothetical protein [Oxalobacteraceae bacterium]